MNQLYFKDLNKKDSFCLESDEIGNLYFYFTQGENYYKNFSLVIKAKDVVAELESIILFLEKKKKITYYLSQNVDGADLTSFEIKEKFSAGEKSENLKQTMGILFTKDKSRLIVKKEFYAGGKISEMFVTNEFLTKIKNLKELILTADKSYDNYFKILESF